MILLGPEDSDVDFRRILEEARNKKGCAIFETFSSDGPREFLVVSSDGTNTKGECAEGGIEESAANVAAKLVFFNEWKTVANGTWKSSVLLGVRRKER